MENKYSYNHEVINKIIESIKMAKEKERTVSYTITNQSWVVTVYNAPIVPDPTHDQIQALEHAEAHGPGEYQFNGMTIVVELRAVDEPTQET